VQSNFMARLKLKRAPSMSAPAERISRYVGLLLVHALARIKGSESENVAAAW